GIRSNFPMRSINPNTRFSLTLVAFAGIASSLVWGTYQATNAMRDIRDELVSIRKDLQTSAENQWTVTDMERFAGRMRWENRNLELSVPEPAKVKAQEYP